MATSIMAAVLGYGYAWSPEEKIRDELAAGLLKHCRCARAASARPALPRVLRSRAAGPGVLRLAEIIREEVTSECGHAHKQLRPDVEARTRAMTAPATRPVKLKSNASRGRR